VFLSQCVDHCAEPVAVVGLDAELALPFGVDQIVVPLRQIGAGNEPRIIGGDKNVVARADPFMVRLDRLGCQIGGCRQIDLLQQAFPMQRFHRRRAGLEGIGIESAAARLDDGALQNVFRAAAP
jgi:hypothetical protein